MRFAAIVAYIPTLYFQHFKVINFDNLKPFFIFNNLCHIALLLWAGRSARIIIQTNYSRRPVRKLASCH